MLSPANPHGVAVVGSGSDARYVIERFLLRQDFRLVRTSDHGSSALFQDLLNDEYVSLIYATDCCGSNLLETGLPAALRAKKHLVLRSGVVPDPARLRHLAECVTDDTVAIVDEPQRWDEDFLSARSLIDAGKLGSLKRIRFATHELAFPGELFPQGVLRDLGLHVLDQLLALVNDTPVSYRLRRCCDVADNREDGFVAILEFAGGASALVEIQTRSLLSSRSGWYLEGTTGAYRNGRLYTRTPDGEIVDEPIEQRVESRDPFLDALSAALRGDQSARSQLVSLSHAAGVQDVINALVESSGRDCGGSR